MRKLLTEHLAVVLSTMAAVTVVAKVWTVAHGGLTGIAAVVSTGGLTTLIGALLAGLPAIGTACLLAASVFVPEAMREGDELRGPVVGTVAAIGIGFVLAPALWFAIGVGLFVFSMLASGAAVAARRAWARRSSRRLPFLLRTSQNPNGASPMATLVLIAILGWLAVATSDRPWLPSEDVTTTSGTVTGYVLEDSSGVILMRESDRTVLRFADDEVTKRTVCSSDTRPTRSLMGRIFWRDDFAYPRCSGR